MKTFKVTFTKPLEALKFITQIGAQVLLSYSEEELFTVQIIAFVQVPEEKEQELRNYFRTAQAVNI